MSDKDREAADEEQEVLKPLDEEGSEESERRTMDETPPLSEQEQHSAAIKRQTILREQVTPFLPPPLIRGIKTVDTYLEPHVGSEASVSILLTLLVGWLLYILLTNCRRTTGRALVNDEQEVLEKQLEERADSTVLLVGPQNAGKTRLFCHLVYNKDQETVMSIQPNVEIINGIRYLDWPGHFSSLNDLKQMINSAKDLRIVLVVDATQPVRSAADKLYQILQLIKGRASTKIFVACHKKDIPKAKNERRIKIQLRTELERLFSIRDDDWVKGTALNWEDHAKFYFGATSYESPELVDFCRNGKFPAAT